MEVTSKLKGFWVILAWWLSGNVASACIWVTGTTYEGDAKSVSGLGAAVRLRHFLQMDHHAEGLRMEAGLAGSTNFNNRSDYAVSLVYLGKAKEAVELFRTLETEQPGTYMVAANLGTALELMGNNQEALHWIREGIRRNSQSHKGTEWLHAKILEAKIAQANDPDYFRHHSVLELDPREASKSIVVDGQSFSPKAVCEAIQYQLQERLQFVKPPDPAVASLLFDYAAIEASTKTLESANGLLKMAQEYGYPAERVQAQINLYDRKIAGRKAKQYVFYGFLALVAIGVLVIFNKMGIFFLSSKSLRKHRAGR